MPSLVEIPLITPKQPNSLAALEVINFFLLVKEDKSEIARLLLACQTHGFFHLDLRNDVGKDAANGFEDLLAIMKVWFNQPVEEKIKYDIGSDKHGYKPLGQQSGVIENKKDGWETLRLLRSKLQKPSSTLPDVVNDNFDIFSSFTSTCHFILMTILGSLSDSLNLEAPARFENFHQDESKCRNNIMFLRYPEQTIQDNNVGHLQHTDIGSLTLLFVKQWGLQVFSPRKQAWEYVEPKPGHAIVNVADSLRFLSGHKLRSALHRVIPYQGMQEERFSIAYFLGPEDGTVLEANDGERVTAGDWHDRKYNVFRESHAKQKLSSTLTGGMEVESL